MGRETTRGDDNLCESWFHVHVSPSLGAGGSDVVHLRLVGDGNTSEVQVPVVVMGTSGVAKARDAASAEKGAE